MVARNLPLRLLLLSPRCMCLIVVCHFCATSTANLMPFVPPDPCYGSDGKPVRCEPETLDPIFRATVRASETCGEQNPIVLCRTRADQLHKETRDCDLCQMSGPSSHPVKYLTDAHNPSNATCWYSNGLTTDELGERRNVTVDISFGKKYDISSVVLHFCTCRPETMAIYKSKDHGKNWEPFQYYSKRCRSVFGMNPRSPTARTTLPEAVCSDRESDPYPATGGTVSLQVKHSTGAVTSPHLAHRLEEWPIATDVKIVLIGVYNSDPVSPIRTDITTNFMENVRHNRRRQAPASGLFYGISNIKTEARCACNGHASRCEMLNGQISCICKHKTEGRDCERCKPFHFDRPWRRATEHEANECIPCNCNRHARRCRFNSELYSLSGKSGGICYNCRHNTDGRHCHYCKEGYYRNKRRPIAHRKACKPCRCHKFGAAGKTCNQTTGQCTCKDGVVGLTCNTCATGYQQSTSEIAPCIKIPAKRTDEDDCHVRCKTSPRRLNLKKFCKRDFVIQALATKRTDDEEWTWFTVRVLRTFKSTKTSPILEGQLHKIKLRSRDASCLCPKVREARKYLMTGTYDNSTGTPIIDAKGMAALWRESDKRRLLRMMNKAKRGKCR